MPKCMYRITKNLHTILVNENKDKAILFPKTRARGKLYCPMNLMLLIMHFHNVVMYLTSTSYIEIENTVILFAKYVTYFSRYVLYGSRPLLTYYEPPIFIFPYIDHLYIVMDPWGLI